MSIFELAIEAVEADAPVEVQAAGIAEATFLPSPVDITVDGHRMASTWRAVAGATGARVASSTVTIHATPTAPSRSLGVVAGGSSATRAIRFSSPEPGTLIRGIRIHDLVRVVDGDEIEITSQATLDALGLRLIVSPVLDGADQAPVVAVGPVDEDGEVPPQLTGGSLSGSMLSVPDLVGTDFVVKLVTGDRPDDFSPQQFDHGDVTLLAAPMPVGLHVDDPSGAEVYAVAGPQRETVSVDLTAAMNRHVGGAATSGEPISSSATVRSDATGSASIVWVTRGAVIERKIGGRPEISVEGAPTELLVPPPHPGRPPTRTVADVTVTHLGMAVHPISDPVPAADAGLGGPTVRGEPVVRALPSDALRDQTLRRVGVVGWPRGVTDLTLAVLGRTATVESIEPPTDREPARVIWFDIGEVLVDGPIEVSLTATRGAFGWVADPEPCVQLAIATTPTGERVSIGGRTITLTGDETATTGLELAGVDRFEVDTDQFCTVRLANAVMEFAP